MASWRDVLPIHPAAELFPPMSPDELRALGKDIIKNGLTSPIAVWSDGKATPLVLLDGISRLDAIEIATGSPAEIGPPSLMAGKDFLAVNKVVVLDRSVDPWAFVISANVHRRHLTAEQRRELIAKLIKADPSRSDRQIGEMIKADHKTVGAVRAEKAATGELSPVEKRVGADGKSRRQPARKTTPKTMPKTTVKGDDIGAASASEIERKDARIGELEAGLEIENLALRSEVEEARAVRRPEGEGDAEGNELGALFCLWDRASLGVREKFKLRVGLVAVEPSAKAGDDGLDIPASLRRAAR